MPDVNGLPYPALSDPNNPPADFLALATAVDGKLTTLNGKFPVSVANGGTGATTVADAQDSLRVGLVPIDVPTVVATGGTATESGLNQISFTNCTDIRLQGIFTSSFKHYRIIMYITSASATADLSIRFMDGTTPVTAAGYNRHGFVAQSASSSLAYTGQEGQTEAKFADVISSTDVRNVAVMDIVAPFVTGSPTFVNINARGRDGTGGFRHYGQIIEYNKIGTHSGILFKTSTGNFSGNIEVYGYNN